MAESKALSKREMLQNFLTKEAVKASLRKVAAKHMTADTVVNMILLAGSRQARLFECTHASILKSAIVSTKLGLDCSGILGKAYLVPYKNAKINKYEAQLIVGYQGLIELARRAGDIRKIEAHVVHEKDEFELIFGPEQKLVHKPDFSGTPGMMKCVYAYASYDSGVVQIECMTKKQVDGIMARSKAKTSGPWQTDYEEMAKKTVVRRLCKYLKLTPEIQEALQADDLQFDEAVFEETGNAAEQEKKRGVKSVKSKVKDTVKNNSKKAPDAEPDTPEPEEINEALSEEPEPESNGLDDVPTQPPAEEKKADKKTKSKKGGFNFKCTRCPETFMKKPEDGLCPECMGEVKNVFES